MTEVIADCKNKIDEIKYRTVGFQVGADASLKTVVDEVDAWLVVNVSRSGFDWPIYYLLKGSS